MLKENFNTIASNPNTKRLLPKLELIKILHKYSTVRQKELLSIEQQNERKLSHTTRQKEAVLDHIDKELFTTEDKLIANVQAIEAESILDNISDISICPNLKADSKESLNKLVILDKNKARTRQAATNRKETPRANSVNVSPLRLNESEVDKRMMTSTIKHKDINYKKPNVKVLNISKFINKPKQLDKITNDTSTSRSNSITVYRKNKSTEILNIPRNTKFGDNNTRKRNQISFPSANARNNDKIIVDLQTMFGKNVEHLEGIVIII